MGQPLTVRVGGGRRQDRGLVPQGPWAGRPLAGPWPLGALESLGGALEPGVPGPQSAEHTASRDSTSQEGVSHPVVGKSSGGKWVLPQSPGRFQPFCSEGNGGKEVKVLSLIWCKPGLTWTEAWPWALGEGRKQQELEKRGSAERGQRGEQQVGDQAPDVFLQMNPGFLFYAGQTTAAKILGCSLSGFHLCRSRSRGCGSGRGTLPGGDRPGAPQPRTRCK